MFCRYWVRIGEVQLDQGRRPGGLAGAVVAEYPELTLDDVLACLAYAAERETHEVRLHAPA